VECARGGSDSRRSLARLGDTRDWINATTRRVRVVPMSLDRLDEVSGEV
jgi:hypothetical protein